MDEIANPHDAYFRESFGRAEIAQDFLRVHLPDAVLAEVDLDSLEISKDTYVASNLRAVFSDLVYRVRWRGQPLTVYVLFEHKSRPEHWTQLQILRYLAAEGDAYRKQKRRARFLPPVLPLVIYHGKRRWRVPKTFHELISPLSPELAPYVPNFTYVLVDLSPQGDAQVKGKVLTRLVQLAMRGIFSGAPVERLTELLALIALIEDRTTAMEILESLLRYYVQGTREVDEPTACALLQQHSDGDPIMQTFIERYIEQGKQQGLELGLERGRTEGRQAGRLEGRLEGQAAILLRQIDRKFGTPSAAVQQLIASADQDTLLRWSDRILTAESIDALLH